MLATDVELGVASFVALCVLTFVGIQLRRAVLFQRGATVACAVRRSGRRRGHDWQGWQGGVARFDPDALRAYRIVGIRMRPYAELPRSDLAIGERRAPTDGERRRLMADPVVVCVETGDATCELALGRGAVPGLLAWVEGRPVR